MAFQDPTTVVIGGVTWTLNKLGTTPGKYEDPTHAVGLFIGQRRTKRNRYQHEIRLDHSKMVPDPANGAISIPVSASARFVVDVPGNNSYTTQQQVDLLQAVASFLNLNGATPTQLAAVKLANGEA